MLKVSLRWARPVKHSSHSVGWRSYGERSLFGRFSSLSFLFFLLYLRRVRSAFEQIRGAFGVSMAVWCNEGGQSAEHALASIVLKDFDGRYWS